MVIFCDEQINDTLLLSDQNHGFYVLILVFPYLHQGVLNDNLKCFPFKNLPS
jgi:hypothetical protein